MNTRYYVYGFIAVVLGAAFSVGCFKLMGYWFFALMGACWCLICAWGALTSRGVSRY